MSFTMADLYAFHSKSFAAQLHTTFQVHSGNAAPVKLELIEVNEPPSPPRVECFSLHLRGPVAPRLGQGIHRFEHATLGSLDMFLTVTGADEQGTNYEVIFHRLRPKQP